MNVVWQTRGYMNKGRITPFSQDFQQFILSLMAPSVLRNDNNVMVRRNAIVCCLNFIFVRIKTYRNVFCLRKKCSQLMLQPVSGNLVFYLRNRSAFRFNKGNRLIGSQRYVSTMITNACDRAAAYLQGQLLMS